MSTQAEHTEPLHVMTTSLMSIDLEGQTAYMALVHMPTHVDLLIFQPKCNKMINARRQMQSFFIVFGQRANGIITIK